MRGWQELPPEMRDIVYSMAYTHDGPVYIRGHYAYNPSKPAKITLPLPVCKAFYQESLTVFASTNTFHGIGTEALVLFTRVASLEFLVKVRALSLEYPSGLGLDADSCNQLGFYHALQRMPRLRSVHLSVHVFNLLRQDFPHADCEIIPETEMEQSRHIAGLCAIRGLGEFSLRDVSDMHNPGPVLRANTAVLESFVRAKVTQPSVLDAPADHHPDQAQILVDGQETNRLRAWAERE